MKKYILFLTLGLLSCSKNDETQNENLDYKQEMRNFVIGISQYSKNVNLSFKVIPQNGIELVTNNGDISSGANMAYLAAIDGNGQEDLNFGYDNDDQATASEDTNYLSALLDVSKNNGKTILVTDYCSTHSKMMTSYNTNNAKGYISFAANERELFNIPDFPTTIYNENTNNITSLAQAKNFLYLINPSNFTTKASFTAAVSATNYDVLLMDLYFNDGTAFTSSQINSLKTKANGGKRLVISYMSIGEAEDYRYYWQTSWATNKPEWLDALNPDWPGNYKVKYWKTDWQNIIYGKDSSYLKKILDANFDGVYLDIIDAFEFYDN